MTATVAIPAYQQSVAAVAEALGSDTERGLSGEVARQRLERDGPNTLTAAPSATWFERVLRQFTEPLVLLLFAALAISLLAWYFEDESAWPIDAVVIGLILVINAGLGAFQERRADQAVQALAEMTVGQAVVVRDGAISQVPVTNLVVGDLVALNEGDVVAADARVVTSHALMAAEAALTGESLPVTKQDAALDATVGVGDRSCMVHAGTVAVSGHAHVLVTATGMDTEVGHIADMLATTETYSTPLEKEIERVSRFLGVAVLVIACVIGVVIAIRSTIDSVQDVVDVLIIAVSVAVAAVPEGLPAVLSVVLAIGVSRMARQNALVKRLASAETLGAATIICTDKTGTLTRNEMQVVHVAVPSGRFTLGSNEVNDLVARQTRDCLIAAAVASNVEFSVASNTSEQGDKQLVGDPTETALVLAAQAVGVSTLEMATIERIDERPFHADRKRMSVLVRGISTDPDLPLTIITKGAPDVLLDFCTCEQGPTGPRPLNSERKTHWQNATSELANQAMRTLLVARRNVATGSSLADLPEDNLTVLGLLGLMDPPRTEVAEAIATAQGAGIRVVMLTGDHPSTAASVAAAVGISRPGESALTGTEIDNVDNDELAELLKSATVFARVAPAHKLRMVRALQHDGHVVAMTGDGVNDAPALKAADIGTAMGKSGTGVAREAADMVLTDDNFATIVEAVRGGRTIFNNVKRFLRYLLSSNVGEVLTIFLGVAFAGTIGLGADGAEIIAPLTAVQILWINLLTDSGPAFALGVDPASSTIMSDRPRTAGERVIDGAMQRGILIVGLTMALITLVAFDAKLPGGLIDGSSDVIAAQTAAFTVLVLAQLFNCFSARSDFESARTGWRDNPLLLLAVAVSLLLQIAVVYVPFLQEGFGTTSLSATDWVVATALASTVLIVSEIRKWVERAVA